MPYLSSENKLDNLNNLRRRVVYQNYFRRKSYYGKLLDWTFSYKYLYDNNICAYSKKKILDDAKYIICNKCNYLIDYNEVINYNNDSNSINLLCPMCIGYLNYVYHYNTLAVVI